MTIAIRKPSLGSAATAFLAQQHKLLIGGQWVAEKSGKTFPVEDPATEEVIGHVPAGDKADVDAAVAAARTAFETGPWPRILPGDCSRLIWRLGDLLAAKALPSRDFFKAYTEEIRRASGGTVEVAPLAIVAETSTPP